MSSVFEILVIYRWASLGGVERMLLNRAHAFKARQRNIRLSVYFLEDIGGVAPLRAYAAQYGLEDVFRLVEDIQDVRPDLVINIDTPEAVSSIPDGCPWVVECHSGYVENRAYLANVRPDEGFLRGIWTPSRKFVRQLESEFPHLRGQMHVVSNSLVIAPTTEPARTTAAYPGIPVLYLGRADPLKNVGEMVSIVRHARDLTGLDLRALVVGDVYDSGLAEHIEREGMSPFTTLMPPVDFHQSASVLEGVREQGGVFISASRAESFGLSAAEAMGYGLPVLLSDIPEHRALVLDNERLLFRLGDVEAAAGKLAWLISEGGRAASAWCRHAVTEYSEDRFLDEWDRAIVSAGFPSLVGAVSVEAPSVSQPALLDLWSLIEEQIKALQDANESRSTLEQALEAVNDLHQTAMGQRDAALAECDAAVAERGRVEQQLQSSQRLVADLTASYSWRITAPIRFAIRFSRHGLLVEDRKWFEGYLRRTLHRLPFSTRQKDRLYHWYGRRFGYPVSAPTNFLEPCQGLSGSPAPVDEHGHARGGEGFVTPETWRHSHRPYGVLCLPIIDWHFRFQRPQQLARQFARSGHPVAYVSLGFASALSAVELEPGVTGVTLPGPRDANVYQTLPDSRVVDGMVQALLEHLQAYPVGQPWICVVQLPFWAGVAAQLRQRLGCPVVYDCMDDHSGFSTNSNNMVAAEERLLREADLVVASSQVLLEKVRAEAGRSVLVRNAVDYAHFAQVPDQSPAMAGLTIGYYGAIADWFDSNLVAGIAKLRPAWRFVLIGSTFSAETQPLEECNNIVLPGEQPYTELPSLIADWDCCIIPFKRLPLTEATNPVKVYEMLAAGKPVVAVALPELMPIADMGLLTVASDSEAFVQGIESEIAQDTPAKRLARRQFAAGNTWENRRHDLDVAIRDIYPLVSVVVVTFNNLALNRLCLESLFQDTDYPNYEVIVVDNASSDGTAEYLRSLDHPRLRVILNQDNKGFSAANNQGAAIANGDYLCLLNNDTVVAGAWLSTLVSHLRANPSLGLVGPVTNAIGNEAQISVGYRDLLDMPAWSEAYCRQHRGKLEDISMLAFFCVLMPRAVFDAVGWLDERFGVGMFEDDDYNKRVRQAGYQVKLARDAYIHHWQRASFKILGEATYLDTYYENQKKYQAKWVVQSLTPVESGKWHRLLEASQAAPRTIVFAPSIGWSVHLFQRPHHLARVLAQAGYVVVFDCSNSHDHVELLDEVEPRLFLFKGAPELLGEMNGLTLWTFTYNYDYRDHFPADVSVIYDWIDDLTVFPQDQGLLARLHQRAMQEADLVASVAQRLHQTALRSRPDALYLPNAVESGRFESPPDPNPALQDPAFAKLLASNRPIAGYYGALARWFDYALLERVAMLRPDWQFVLIGPDHDSSIQASGIMKTANIHWLGPRDYVSLPGYLHCFDVAMIPFLINDITLATSPLKLFEYFAGGRAVVTTPMPECQAYPEVFIAADAESFAKALDAAREQGLDPDYRSRLQVLSEENTWAARASAALMALDAAGAATHESGHGGAMESAGAMSSLTECLNDNHRRVLERFKALETPQNKHFYHALAKHLSALEGDPCLPMYFNFALSANARGREAAKQLSQYVDLQGKRHLDVGCTYGGFLVAFSEMGAQSIGFDLDPVLLELGTHNFLDTGYSPSTYLKDITNPQDLADFMGSIDCITCNDVIEHVSDPAIAIKHMAGLLGEGGAAYFEIPNRDALPFVMADRHYQLFGITQLDKEDALEYFTAHAPGVRYTVEHYLRLPEYLSLMEASGLHPEVLPSTLHGVDLAHTRQVLAELEGTFQARLSGVPDDVRERVGRAVENYLDRARNALDAEAQDPHGALLTYGASFWKILARKPSALGAGSDKREARPVPDAFHGWHFQSGRCNICGQATRFFYQEPALYREQLSCEHCRSTSRYRSIARGLLMAIEDASGVSVKSLSELPPTGIQGLIRIYDTQPPFEYSVCAYPIASYLRKCDWIELSLSAYKPRLPLGAALGPNVTNQNLEQLTFPDGYFDIVITSDVMEHVRKDTLAHAEIARVLSPGGTYLFTVPHNWAWETNQIRVQVSEDGGPDADLHLLPPEYHGDANSDEGSGVLAYRAYGRELADQLAQNGLALHYEKNDLPDIGVLNTELFYCKKRAEDARARVYVHVGAPKTGTTLIQAYLHTQFEHSDYFYLDPEILNQAGFLDRVLGLSDHHVDLTKLAREVGWSGRQALVISHETLLGYGELLSTNHESYFYGHARTNAERLKTMLGDVDAHLIYYMRRQDDFVESFYLEHLGYNPNFKRDFESFINVQQPERMSWLRIAQDLVEIFGEERVSFGVFEEIKQGPKSYVANFLRRIGVHVSESQIPELAKERPSMSQVAYELAAQAIKNEMSQEDKAKLMGFLRVNFSNATHPKAKLLSPEQRHWIMEKCRPDNIELFSRYLKDSPSDLWYRDSL